MSSSEYVSRGGLKLEHALRVFNLEVNGLDVLDIGSSTGGFVDCLLRHGASKVYALDTAYGELAWKLRQDQGVRIIEKTNILHFESLPEKVDLITIDVTFTSLTKILPVIKKFLKHEGVVVALVKPQYENQKLALKNKGVIPEKFLKEILERIINFAKDSGWGLLDQTESPILGKDGNREFLIYLK